MSVGKEPGAGFDFDLAIGQQQLSALLPRPILAVAGTGLDC